MSRTCARGSLTRFAGWRRRWLRRAPALHRSERGAIRCCAADHSQWHRGSHHPSRPRRSIDLPDIASDRRRQAAVGARTLATIRARAPGILGALLDLVVHGLRTLPGIILDRLPRMADFALWAAACETALWPPGTFASAYQANRRAAIESIIEADPVAACVLEIMSERSSWAGSAADLLRVGARRGRDGISTFANGWPKNPRALAGRLRRAQTFLRALGIDITFGREGRAGSRIIGMRSSTDNTVSTVSTVRKEGGQITHALISR